MKSSDVRHTLLVETHRAIDAAVDDALAMLENRGVEPVYPPGVELSEAEARALATLPLSADLRSALQKVIRDAASRPLFQLFSLMDGVADPRDWPAEWLGVAVLPKADDADEEMWHDDFFETYWAYEGARHPDV